MLEEYGADGFDKAAERMKNFTVPKPMDLGLTGCRNMVLAILFNLQHPALSDKLKIRLNVRQI